MRFNEFANQAAKQKNGQLSPVGSTKKLPANPLIKKVEDLAKKAK